MIGELPLHVLVDLPACTATVMPQLLWRVHERNLGLGLREKCRSTVVCICVRKGCNGAH